MRMAHYTKHPVSAPPTAPERESTSRLLLRAYIVLVLVLALAHSAVYNLIGIIGAGIALATVTLITLAIGIPMLAKSRPQPFPWRRLPWAALVYTALALVSVLWSRWPQATLLTGALLAATTINALFIAQALSWQEIFGALASAFQWVLGLSLAIELWAALVVGPILPNFLTPPKDFDPQLYWVRANLFDGGRLQGIVGNANLLAIMSLFAMIVFAVLLAARQRARSLLALWFLLAAYLFVRASSATAFVCAAAVVVVLVIAGRIRRAQTPGARTRVYAVWTGVAVIVLSVILVFRVPLLQLLGRSSDLTGRLEKIWVPVLERALSRPVFGNGFSSPWLPTEPLIDGWIRDHGITVFHAHNMWLDVFLQLGAVGALVMLVVCASLLWRAWFFAIDRPRWDLRANRPYSPLTFIPHLFTVVLLVQGLAESTPIMLWGWLLIVLFSFKIKAVPLIGVGLSEQARVTDRGHIARRVP